MLMRRTTILVSLLAVILSAVAVSAWPAGASPVRALDPSQIDPTQLALPQSALPAGVKINHSAVSDNHDADGDTTPPDGFKAQLRIAHQNLYEVLGRITGYRMDFDYTVQGASVGTEYLASIFHSADEAKKAMNDAIGPGTLVTIIGTPLPTQCTAGDACSAYSGPNPGTPNKVVFAIFTEGPILVETASQVPAAQFDALEPAMATALFALLQAADTQAKAALNGSAPPSTSPPATIAPTTASTVAPPPATAPPAPTATPTPKPKCPKNASLKKGKCTCKKGYTMKKGKCVKKKKK
jgi:hypothetical protein